ncbi:MAG: polymerase subunit gamma and tau, polymerase subunit gamma/tau protein [Candidatus Nomurabacteria bacterium]|nr:polymerase subunit gamma and tau, polymerase subunit gamma/tau protein [Candidatus Nomurabacteria bacterium]
MSDPHLALYRKYRPQKFDDVVGQVNAIELLTSAIKQKKISHAYLFSGGRGTGKTTVARIVAREIGCDPMDIIEIDAASNRGIDEIRELREAVRTAPFVSPYKVYIVDEAHMLTKEAANALLKTLEEPPSHVVFILATTDPEKLPQTITSRCQKIVFKQPEINVLTETLIKIAEKEGYLLPKETGELIAKEGKGSYRDALGILEQVLTTGDKKINHESVMEKLGTPEEESFIELLRAVCEKNAKGILKITDDLKKRNIDAIKAYDVFLELVREALILRVNQANNNEDDKSRVADLSEIAKSYPQIISSRLILELLEKRNLLEVSQAHSWVAFTAILLSFGEY